MLIQKQRENGNVFVDRRSFFLARRPKLAGAQVPNMAERGYLHPEELLPVVCIESPGACLAGLQRISVGFQSKVF